MLEELRKREKDKLSSKPCLSTRELKNKNKIEELNLYTNNLDDSINHVHLRNLYEKFGHIASYKVILSLFSASDFLTSLYHVSLAMLLNFS